MSDIIIGIDLGTTNSEAAVVDRGRVKVIEGGYGKILPSFVGVGAGGELLIGESARNQYSLHPERTVKSIKRLMGQDVTVNLAGQTYAPPEISAIILRRLKQTAEICLGRAVDKAVITVPAYFSDAQRQATRLAGEIAGLEVVRMINEPTAAALAYGALHSEGKRMLVYDLGGGTFDVSVVRSENGVVEVLSSHGDNRLGGDDFDRMIADYLLDQLRQRYPLDVGADAKAMARLVRAAEKAKLTLSDQPYVIVEEEYLLSHDGMPVHLSAELSRPDYEAMIEDSINRTLEAVHIALRDAGMKVKDIDEILLVGGSTRTPCIRERLFELFGFQPHGEIDADLCVAMGAAIQASVTAGEKAGTVLVDVTPYTYGTSALGSLNGEPYPFAYVPIIHKNSVLPSRKTEAFATTRDGQDYVDVAVFQGEDPDALNNIRIGEFRIGGLQDVKAGNVVTVTLDLDVSGLLQVSAREKATGLEKSIAIKHALARFQSDALEAARQRVTSLFGQMEPKSAPSPDISAASTAEAAAARTVVDKARKLMEHASGDDRDDMAQLIEIIESHIDSGNVDALAESVDRLSDIVYYLES